MIQRIRDFKWNSPFEYEHLTSILYKAKGMMLAELLSCLEITSFNLCLDNGPKFLEHIDSIFYQPIIHCILNV